MKTLTTMLVLGGLVVASVPAHAFAQTYGYITTSGTLQTISANTAQEAINTAPNIALHSGVMTMSGTQTTVVVPIVAGSNTQLYAYVTVFGTLKTIVATSPEQAIALAPDRAVHSGVMLVVK